jgi:hypothetical protein
MLSASQVNPKPTTNAITAPITICVNFAASASFRVNFFILLTARKRTAALAILAIQSTLKAGINRGTFYLHYLDKYDLLEQMEIELLEGLEEYMHILNYQEMLECHKANTPYDPLVQVFQYLKQKGRILSGLLGAKGDPAFSQKLKSFLKNGIFAGLIDSFQDESISKQYFSAFATSAYLGIIEDWLYCDMKQSPEEMAIIYVKIKFFGMKL